VDIFDANTRNWRWLNPDHLDPLGGLSYLVATSLPSPQGLALFAGGGCNSALLLT
jgi:hypothetical protein